MNRGKKLRAGMVLLLLIFCFAMPAQAAFSKKAPSGLKAKKKRPASLFPGRDGKA